MLSLYYQVCKEAGLGVSLFKRLSLLGFEKHLLNMQYQMSPCISLFPNALFYEGRIIDSVNVKSAAYNKDYLDLPFVSYAFLNIVHGKEEREGSGNSWQNMVEVAVVMHVIQSVFKCIYLVLPRDAYKYLSMLIILHHNSFLVCSYYISVML
jgi:superfamily I DNA and/or RNA helicase